MPRRHRRTNSNFLEMNVNITPLMDVLTVLLFFLIKSFTISSSTLSPPKDIRLPASLRNTQVEETVMVSVSENDVRGNNEVLMKLRNGVFLPQDIGQDQRTLVPLQNFLKVQLDKRNAIYQGAGDLSFLPPGKLLIHADKQLTFATLKYLFHTASVSGYSDYQFVVVREQAKN